ncbi:MBOAT family O-acyltransferase [Mucilaginibacter lacusdianchii]|uniref:MBOAT family O-acyltransferase n=1 Tax=Mucilaginibacter lacusdianchii TaxID=2684211 RepID=UPI00131AC38B|nr:MBOAT family O-acyltransferase [Mucilaginibacter sp. JXJ CY 39]
MIFNSLAFAVFFPIVTLFYFVLPFRFRWIWLLSASVFFYMFFKPIYILILGITIVIDYYAGIYIEKAQGKKNKKLLLACSLVANIGVLVFFKYFNFLNANITSLGDLLGFKNNLPYLTILLPVGLSFHTFQAMSYTIEVYRGHQPAEKQFGYYSLYVMYYPQLVAGPIERPQNVLHQFHQKHHFDTNRFMSGLKVMLWGLFKKVVVADTLAAIVNDYYYNVYTTHTNSALTIFFFSIQIYCDFSGYTDIAIGASRIMGIELMKNFKYPYFSHTITEFWHRWHISLSTWFRDYLYIPLGGNKTKFHYIRNILIVFLVSGIWHGASWTFVVWGLIHGLLSIAERLLGVSKSKSVLMGVSTFIIVSLTWVFFRADNFHVAAQMFHNLTYRYFSDVKHHSGQILLVLLFLGIEYFTYKKGKELIFYLLNRKVVRYAAYLMVIEAILFVFNQTTSQQFIYFQF